MLHSCLAGPQCRYQCFHEDYWAPGSFVWHAFPLLLGSELWSSTVDAQVQPGPKLGPFPRGSAWTPTIE